MRSLTSLRLAVAILNFVRDDRIGQGKEGKKEKLPHFKSFIGLEGFPFFPTHQHTVSSNK